MIPLADGRGLLTAENELSLGHVVAARAVLRLAPGTSATRSYSSWHSVNYSTRRRASSAAYQNCRTRPVSKYDGYNVFECFILPGRRSHVHARTQLALHHLQHIHLLCFIANRSMYVQKKVSLQCLYTTTSCICFVLCMYRRKCLCSVCTLRLLSAGILQDIPAGLHCVQPLETAGCFQLQVCYPALCPDL